METLLGTREDAREMRETFTQLGYVIHEMHNPTKKQMVAQVKEISNELGKYKIPKEEEGEKVIIFAFSGHGDSRGQIELLCANDGDMIDFHDEIVLHYTKHPGLKYVPKLFFIDACRGGQILVSKKGGKKVSKSDSTKYTDEVYYAKGVEYTEANYCIAYATIPYHVSYASKNGSIWMPKLARALREMKDSFQNIAATVMKEVRDSTNVNPQQCSMVNQLNCGPLRLQKES